MRKKQFFSRAQICDVTERLFLAVTCGLSPGEYLIPEADESVSGEPSKRPWAYAQMQSAVTNAADKVFYCLDPPAV